MAEADFAGVGFYIGNEALQIGRRDFVVGDEHERRRGDFADRSEVFRRVVGHFFHETHNGRLGGAGGDHQRVTIGRGVLDFRRANRSLRARLVVDDDGLTQLLAHDVG